MTIEERNEIALSYCGLLRTIIKEDYAKFDCKDDLFQIGFLAILKAVSDSSEEKDNPASFVRKYIKDNLNWFLADDYRTTHFDSCDLYDDKIQKDITKIQYVLDKLFRQCLTYVQINLIKLYYGFDGKARSLSDMAEILQCSRENVRLQLNTALRKLKYGNSNQRTRELKHKLLKELKGWTEK